MKNLTVSPATFNKMILGLIKTGLTFDAKELDNGQIYIFNLQVVTN